MTTDDLPAPGDESSNKPLVELTSEERNWAMLCHLSSYLGYLLAGLSFVGPLVCWLVKKDTSKFVDSHGKESLNFQLNIFIYLLVTGVLAFVLTFATCGIGFVLLAVPAAIAVYGMIMPIIAGIKASSGEYYEYPLTFRLVK